MEGEKLRRDIEVGRKTEVQMFRNEEREENLRLLGIRQGRHREEKRG